MFVRTSLIALSLFTLGCGAPVGAGRCTDNSQCPAGTMCDPSWGVCVGPSTADGGNSNPNSNSNSLAGDYGRACKSTAECGAGTTCASLGQSGMCLAPESTKCPAGTSAWGFTCSRGCTTDADCHSTNECVADPNGPGKICWLRGSPIKPPSFIGGACVMNSDCNGGIATCANDPGGRCTQGCTTTSDCPSPSVCAVVRSGAAAACMSPCTGTGLQSSCRTGYVCRAVVNGVSVCTP